MTPTTPPPDWAVLCYLCGDHPALEAQIETQLQQLVRAGASKQLAVAVQRDRRAGAERFILRKRGAKTLPKPAQTLGAAGTGDPDILADFLRWGLETCPARQVAVFISGLGIAHSRSVTGIAAPEEGDLFTFADDATAGDALDPFKLNQALDSALSDGERSRLELLVFDAQAVQFIELAHQLAGRVTMLVGPQLETTGAVWDYTRLIRAWKKSLRQGQTGSRQLARLAVETAQAADAAGVSALDLSRLDTVTRAFDGLTQALLQSLGDDIIWDVVWDEAAQVAFNVAPPAGQGFLEANCLDLGTLLQSLRQTFNRAGEEAVSNWYADELDKLNRQELAAVRKLAGPPDTPAADLEQAIAGALPELPPWMANDFKIIQSQRKRAADLAQLAANALALLHPADGGFVTARNPQNGPLSGVSIFRPHNLNKLSKSNYLSLDFNRRAHWAAVLGATNLIACHARALWRLASSLLTTANATVRENLMRRLIGPDSVMVGYRQQFTALAAPPKLTLSLEPHAAGSGASTYRLRLESHETGATVIEQNSRVNAQTIDDALAGLEQLFKQPWVRPEALQYLTALGRTLGEDIIQNLAEYLAQEYRRLAWLGSGDVLPHLQLQLPRQLMRYPWELIHDGEGLLCERFALGRQVFMETGAVRQVTRRRSGVVRALIIGDPLLEAEFLGRAAERGHRWAQLPGAKEEAEQVALTFERLARTMGATLDFDRSRDVHIHQPFTKLQLRQKLRHGNYDIVHFAGHAIFNPQDPEQSAWLLSDGPLWAQEIRNTLAWVETPPWLVYANACEAGMDSGERANRYQGDVFGLATAFINQGVAAYIGPLWPIDDAVALQMAGDFYHTLLIEDRSLGEALHEARQQAKYLALGRDDDDAAAGAPPLPTRMGLSWAGLVLYGDPTGRLLESLWTPHHLAPTAATESPPAQAPPYRPRRMRRPLRPLQSPDAETCALVAGPGMESAPVTRGAADISPAKQVMELVETNGVRYWQTINLKTGARVSLPGSPVEQLARDETTRSALSLQRGAGDYVRLIGRWLIDRNEETLIEGLATRYDRDVVPVEQLLSIGADGSLAPLGPEPWWWLEGNPTARTDRALLIIHGTFSQTASPVAALKDNFLAWAAAHYRGVIGFDHWTLSKTPEENAAQLWQLLDSRLKEGENRLDIITHSRGGLVARALVELLKHHRPVNRVIFVCTPNSGTTAANPANWGRVADTLVNLLHHDSSALFGRLSGLLARLLALGGASLEQLSRDIVSQIPGLQAQNPAATGPRDFLGRLQRGDGPPKGVTYSAVAANYEPQRDEINIKTLAGRRRAKNTAAVDAAADVLFSDFNDLVVDTSHVWAIDPPPEISAAAPPAWLPGAGLLIFNPNRAMPTPPQATTVDKTGVHHTNVFYFKETQDFLRAKLSD